MSGTRPNRVGHLPPRYAFALNPYPDARFSKCPMCNRTMNPRKFPLFIHVDGWGPMSLRKTCRYCPRCEFIIVHQDELEGELSYFSEQHCPDLLGNDYLVLGTVRLKAWKEGHRGKETTLDRMLDNVADFKKVLTLEVDPGGWFPSAAADKDQNRGSA
ncbi:MAG: hypothetical protein AMS14_06610 [Planctomycetes bacterium DG_20]|nr:MAG: hypothetical protein AMS14_06610 [Planctomycetes bacterium DG_20]